MALAAPPTHQPVLRLSNRTRRARCTRCKGLWHAGGCDVVQGERRTFYVALPAALVEKIDALVGTQGGNRQRYIEWGLRAALDRFERNKKGA